MVSVDWVGEELFMPCSQCGSDQGGNGRLCPLCIEENQILKAEQIAKIRLPKQDFSDAYERTIGLFPRVFFLLALSLLVALGTGAVLFYGLPQFQLTLQRLGGSSEMSLLRVMILGSAFSQLCLGLYLIVFTIVRKPWWALGYILIATILYSFGVAETIYGQVFSFLFHLAYLRHLLTNRGCETAAAAMLVSFLLGIMQVVAYSTVLFPALRSFLAYR